MKIYIDVTETFSNQLRTGIQRVVREVVASAEAVMGKLGLEVIPVVAREGYFYPVKDLSQLFATPATKPYISRAAKVILKIAPALYPIATRIRNFLVLDNFKRYCSSTPIELSKNDVVLLLDSFWCSGDALLAAAKLKENGFTVLTVIYDIIPISHQEYCEPKAVEVFAKLFPVALKASNGIIAISNAVANQIRDVMAKSDNNASVMPVSYFYLGADFFISNMHNANRDRLWPANLWGTSSVFMMVGTVEPRKGHAFVVEAFERRWRQGSTDKLLILGKVGWQTEDLVRRVIDSPYFGSLLFMVNDATDIDLKEAYLRAYACVMASYVEGFGLPVIEALQNKVPVIASDIPIFKEIAGKDANFFTLGDIESFNHAVESLQKNYTQIKERLGIYKWITWQESTEQLLSNVKKMAVETREKL